MLVLVVELFVLLIVLVLQIIAGSMALLYIMSTHYTLRGGRSGFNTECGILCTDMRYSISIYHNYYGAAISFRLDIDYINRI